MLAKSLLGLGDPGREEDYYESVLRVHQPACLHALPPPPTSSSIDPPPILAGTFDNKNTKATTKTMEKTKTFKERP